MAIYTVKMDISITEFKHRCLEIVRRVEESGEGVSITRHGRVVAQLEPSLEASSGANEPWKRLRALGGKLEARPDESVFGDEDFEALR
jgi:antitoxin (DNA-binding transcriptional repressor) of toxin-antitoxin stability system